MLLAKYNPLYQTTNQGELNTAQVKSGRGTFLGFALLFAALPGSLCDDQKKKTILVILESCIT